MDEKADAWKKFHNEMKEQRSSKKKLTLFHIVLAFRLVGQGAFWS